MSEMTVGCIRTTVTPPLASGIYGALLEKAERENERLKNFADNVHAELLEAREESLEQARLLGMGGEREARLATERNHYKQALEEIATTIQEYKDSIVQEPAEDFIWAIKAWADKKLREI
jgi:hypothetical protein